MHRPQRHRHNPRSAHRVLLRNLQLETSPHKLASSEQGSRLLIGGDGRHLHNLFGNAPPAAQLTCFYIKYSGIGEEMDETGENRMGKEEERAMVVQKQAAEE